jgi:hypothetical protein
MTALSIRLSQDVTTVTCDRCGQCESHPTNDRTVLVIAVRAFARSHGRCEAPQGRTNALMVAQRAPSDGPDGRIE